MARTAVVALTIWLLRGASCAMNFINPPPFGKEKDYTDNPTYTIGSTVNVAWTAGEQGKGASILLYQLNKTDGVWFGDGQYLTQGAVGVNSYSWIVVTRKNLSDSNLFYLSLFQEGKTSPDANSHYFFLESSSTTSSSSSASSAATSSASPTASQSSTAPTTSASTTPTSQPTNSATNPPPQSSSGLSTGAKAGIGVGVVAALLLGLGAGLLLFRQRKKKDHLPMVASPPNYDEYRYHHASYNDSTLNEAPPKSPVELGPANNFFAENDRQSSHGPGRRTDQVYEM